MRRGVVVAAVLVVVLVTAVTVVVVWRRDGADEPVRIPEREVPFALLEGPSAPGDLELDDGSSGVTLFFAYEDALVAVHRSRPRSASAHDLLDTLFEGPTREETAAGLSSSLGPEPDVTDVTVGQGRAVVNLGGPLPESPEGADRSLALAQIVFTMTEIPGVDEVRFLLDGDAVEVPVGDGTLTREAVVRGDYPVSVVALPVGTR